jgi:hypothetical protein
VSATDLEKVARSERFELPTLGIEIRCSIQLSYERVPWSMIRKSGNRFSIATNAKRLRGDHAQTQKLDHDQIPSSRIMI